MNLDGVEKHLVKKSNIAAFYFLQQSQYNLYETSPTPFISQVFFLYQLRGVNNVNVIFKITLEKRVYRDRGGLVGNWL